MNIETLKYFVALGEARSFSDAAQRFYISQQGFNKAITSLESEVGCKLVNRSNKGISLTEDGRRFQAGALKIIQTYDDTLRALSVHGEDLGTVKGYSGRMGVSPACILSIMDSVERLGLLGNVLVRETETMRGLDLLEGKRWLLLADIPWFAIDEEGFKEAYEVVPVIDTWLGIAGKPPALVDSQPTVSVERAADMTLGIYDNETTRLMYGAIFKDHPMRDVVRATTNFEVLLSSAEEGKYAILLDSFQWRQYVNRKGSETGLMFARLEGHLRSTFGFVFKKSNPPDDEMRTFAESFARLFQRICI